MGEILIESEFNGGIFMECSSLLLQSISPWPDAADYFVACRFIGGF